MVVGMPVADCVDYEEIPLSPQSRQFGNRADAKEKMRVLWLSFFYLYAYGGGIGVYLTQALAPPQKHPLYT